MPAGSYTKFAVVQVEPAGSVPLGGPVFAGFGGHALSIEADGTPSLAHGTVFAQGVAPIATGVPVVLSATYDADAELGRLFVDGVLVASGNAPPPADPALTVGGDGFVGRIGEVALFDAVLADADRALVELALMVHYDATYPRVVFDELLGDAGLVPRGGTDGVLPVAGVVESAGYASIELELWRHDGALQDSLVVPLTYEAGSAAFAGAVTVPAELTDFDLRVWLDDGRARVLVAERTSLVCGDVILVNGQSNALAGDYHGEQLANGAQHPFVRSFGTASETPEEVPFDRHYDVADGLDWFEHAYGGAWPLRLSEYLVEATGVPVLLINGAVDATTIQQHQRNDGNPTDLTTIYGRLLWRAQAAGVDDAVRALLWYQGEADGGKGDLWRKRFGFLRDDWLSDFPALERMYVFQVRMGCGTPNNDVREEQRRLPELFPDVSVMSTTAAPQHDGCHFWYAGYEELGVRLGRLVARDLFGVAAAEVEAPNVVSAKLVDPKKIVLRFHDPLAKMSWDPGAQHSFELDDGTLVEDGKAWRNEIHLRLVNPTTATTVSYRGHLLDGPWIENGLGVGALAFFEVPLQ